MEMIPMTHIRLGGFVVAMASMLFLTACSGSAGGPAAINRDAASRCIQTIDAWKQELANLDMREREFDSISEEIRASYRNATPQGRVALRNRLGEIIVDRDEAGRSADALFNEIMRELEYVPH